MSAVVHANGTASANGKGWTTRVPAAGGLWCPEEARQALTALADPAAGVELMRLPGGQRVCLPGSDVAGLVRQAERWADGAAGLYYSLGTVDPALARPARVGDVLRRRWLLVDLDPRRPRDVSATDAEHESARLLALQVLDGLAGLGWPDPLLVDSGNGFHLLYRLDLANDETTRPLVMRVLRAVKGLYETDAVEIDDKVGNANRHGKLPGCWARKGPDTADRPHRPCRMIHLPGRVEVVGRDLLEELAGPEPKRSDPAAFRLHVPPGNRYGAVALDREVGRLLLAEQRNNALNAAAFSLYRLAAGGVLTEGEVTARLTDAALSVGLPEREIAATLASARAKGLTLPRGIPDRPAPPRPATNGAAPAARPDPAGEAAPRAGWRLDLIGSAELDSRDYRPTWLVRRVLVAGQPAVIGGPSKCMKTSVAIDLAVSLASGTKFLGELDVYRPRRVAVLSGESGAFTLQETARRVCAARGVSLAGLPIGWQFDLPQLADPNDLAALGEGLAADGIEVVVVDPLYLALLAGTVDLQASNLYQMGPLLLGVARACLAAGATPVLLHHSTRPAGKTNEPLELTDLAYSGIAEFARQWLLVSRRERYDQRGVHRLWLAAGGSCGQGGCWAADVAEGELGDDFTGRGWDVELRPAHEERAGAADGPAGSAREAARALADDRRFLEVLDSIDGSGRGTTRRAVRAVLKWSGDRVRRTAERLIGAGLLEAFPVGVANRHGDRETEGIRRTEERNTTPD